jgi:purine-nucleoside phosphorylase
VASRGAAPGEREFPGTYGTAAARVAAEAVAARAPQATAPVGIVLGSGLGALAERIGDAARIPFGKVPGFPSATVVGHAGALVAGSLGGKPVIALAGRFHMYEGHAPQLAGFPVRVLDALGVRTLIISNAAGGIRRTLVPGDLMMIEDHINLMWTNPLTGPVEPGDERFPDMSNAYDAELRRLATAVSARLEVPLSQGIYAGLRGPAYETAAEVRMLERLGADAVGMSTVPEVIVASARRMRVLGISCITNLACGLSPDPLSHHEVLETGARVAEKFERLVTGIIEAL